MLQLQFANFRKDSYLLVEGKEENDHFYIIQSGKVRCFKSNDPKGNSIKIYGAGDFVGVISCMSNHSQIENVIALEDTKCISVRKDQYPELIEKNTPIALKIIRTFANRMRSMNEIFMQEAIKSTSSDFPEHMLDVANYYDKMGKPAIAIYALYHFMKECRNNVHIPQVQERFKSLSTMTNFRNFEPTKELTCHYERDEMIFSESQSGSDMFVIQDGEVAITKVTAGKEVILAVLKKGDMFGEMALLENKPRSACAIAHSPCHLMVINRGNFNQMVSTQPQLISRLTTTFAERLWTSYRQLDNMNIVNPVYKMTDMLALQVEKAKKFIGSYQTELTMEDLAKMVGIPDSSHLSVFAQFPEDKSKGFLVVKGKIFVPDCNELMKIASFYRKMNQKTMKGENKNPYL